MVAPREQAALNPKIFNRRKWVKCRREWVEEMDRRRVGSRRVILFQVGCMNPKGERNNEKPLKLILQNKSFACLYRCHRKREKDWGEGCICADRACLVTTALKAKPTEKQHTLSRWCE